MYAYIIGPSLGKPHPNQVYKHTLILPLSCLLECHFDGLLSYSPIYSMQSLLVQADGIVCIIYYTHLLNQECMNAGSYMYVHNILSYNIILYNRTSVPHKLIDYGVTYTCCVFVVQSLPLTSPSLMHSFFLIKEAVWHSGQSLSLLIEWSMVNCQLRSCCFLERECLFFIIIIIIKNILQNERVCRGDIYQKRRSTGTRWLRQKNEIPLPHNNHT